MQLLGTLQSVGVEREKLEEVSNKKIKADIQNFKNGRIFIFLRNLCFCLVGLKVTQNGEINGKNYNSVRISQKGRYI
jgi:hypothetical protein